MVCKKHEEYFVFFKYFKRVNELNAKHTLNILTMLTFPTAPDNPKYYNIDVVQAVVVDTLNQVQPLYFHHHASPHECIEPEKKCDSHVEITKVLWETSTTKNVEQSFECKKIHLHHAREYQCRMILNTVKNPNNSIAVDTADHCKCEFVPPASFQANKGKETPLCPYLHAHN